MKRRFIYIILISVTLFFIIDFAISALMMKGINNYYGLNQHSKILLIGHSHLMLATDKERLEKETGMKVSKYCREGVNVSDKKMMVDHFLNSSYSDSLKYVFYGVDLATFTGDGLSQNSYKLFYPFMSNNYVNEYINTQADRTDYWIHNLIKSSRFNDDGVKNSAVRGWLDNWDNLKTNTIDVEAYRKKLANGDERRILMNENLMNQFTETVNTITERGIKIILVNTPTLDLLNNYEPMKYQKMMVWFSDFASSNDLVEFIDYNPIYESDYSMFSDRLHLNQHGQQIITTELINYINNLEK